MELQDLIEEFRNQVDDQEQPYLWSDSEVLAYAVDAQDMFVRLTGGIAEAGAAGFGAGSAGLDLCTLALTADSPWSAHSPYILRIRSGRLVTAARDVKFISESDMSREKTISYGQWSSLTFNDTDTGDVAYGVLGVQRNYVRWWRVPATGDTARLNIYRLPYPRIADQEDDLEIDEQHHRHLLLWMKHLAYGKQDAETRDDEKAAMFEAAFRSYCAQATREIERQRYKPRTTRYGGL